MEVRPQELYFLEAGNVKGWLDALEDSDAPAYDAIITRLERVEDGNFGDWGPAGKVRELLFYMSGPGYRIYFQQYNDIVVLLWAGTKKTQDADIAMANKLWKGYNDAED